MLTIAETLFVVLGVILMLTAIGALVAFFSDLLGTMMSGDEE